MKQTPADVYKKVVVLDLHIQEMERKIKRIQNEIRNAKKRRTNLLKQVGNKMGIVLKPIPSYGDHMTLESFTDCVECGGFNDDDGTGYYATETQITDIVVYPSDITKGFDKKWSHVVWFNK